MKTIIELLTILKNAPDDEIEWGLCCAASDLVGRDVITDEEEEYIINYLPAHRPKLGAYGTYKHKDAIWWWAIHEVKLRRAWLSDRIRKERNKK